VLSRKSVHNSQCSLGDNVSPTILARFAPRQTLSGIHANESNPLGNSFKLPAQPAQARAFKAGSRGDKCKECSACLFSRPGVFVVDCRRTLARAKSLFTSIMLAAEEQTSGRASTGWLSMALRRGSHLRVA
jgi:hypothetical protein